MANWQYTLDIQEAWGKAKKDAISTIDLAKEVVKKMREIEPDLVSRFGKNSEIVLAFLGILKSFDRFIANDDDSTAKFDVLFHRLYDWADTEVPPRSWPPDKLCWIKTQF
jgi:hypothetical protein